MKVIRILKICCLAIFAVLSGISCRENTPERHDRHKAASIAEEYAREAFVVKDYLKASRFSKWSTAERVKKVSMACHPDGKYPKEIHATDYMIPGGIGRNSIHIFLEGTNKKRKFFYQILLEGDRKKGYTVEYTARRFKRFAPNEWTKPL